ncbi:MAG TPA: DUF2231 domain-containing protein [Actinomycetes bacterium]|nr:DUF2231 domain-containing protein [Actinomycetes bacterium]
MIPETVGGVPLHPLIVHAVVVLIPLTALGVLAIAVVPRWRSRYGSLVAIVAVISAALVPFAARTGLMLQDILGEDDDIDRHRQLGQTLLYTAIPLALIAIVLWWIGRREERGANTSRGLVMVAGILGVVLAIGVGVQVALIGHSGANAAWGS